MAPRLVVPPPAPKRESLWRKYALIAVGGFATALGGAAFSQGSLWIGGIATRGYVDQAIREQGAETRKAMRGEVRAAIDASTEAILKEVRIGNTIQLERVGVEIRERVGLQAALHAGMDPKRREAAQRAAVNVRAKFDDLVLRGLTPEQAAQRALELAGVPR